MHRFSKRWEPSGCHEVTSLLVATEIRSHRTKYRTGYLHAGYYAPPLLDFFPWLHCGRCKWNPVLKTTFFLNLSLTVLALHTSGCSVHDHSAFTELRTDGYFRIHHRTEIGPDHYPALHGLCILCDRHSHNPQSRLEARYSASGIWNRAAPVLCHSFSQFSRWNIFHERA